MCIILKQRNLAEAKERETLYLNANEDRTDTHIIDKDCTEKHKPYQ